ncbi:MAG: SRPBCC family protein [Candidatus Omnitrophica bacterium]|nr:SRPBCC family protein [Candidatus Omnitrophota bacterium]
MCNAFQGSSEILINSRPEPIWAVLADSTCLPQWATMVKSTTGTAERVGSTRTCQVEWEGRKDQVVERCIEAVPPRKIGWIMEQGMMTKMFSTIQFGFELEPQGASQTLLRLGFLYEPRHLLARLMYALMMRQKMASLRQTLLENLKTLVERRAAAHGV